MSLPAIILIAISAIMHAGWNLLSKHRHPSASFFLLATFAGGVLLLPLLIWHRHSLAFIPTQVWLLIIATGFFMALYYVSLAGAYRSGKMSIAYPLARSSPPILVLVVTFLLGRGEQITLLCLLGALLVMAGCFLLPMGHFKEFRVSNYFNATSGLALMAALGTVGYTLLDDSALRLLRNTSSFGLGIGITHTTLVYAALEAVSCVVWLGLAVAFQPGERESLRREWRADKLYPLLAGLAIWASYVLVLVSLAFVVNVSYVAAFRQMSIPLGVALGVLLLKEPAPAPKITAVAIILLGLVLVAVS